LSDKFNLEFLQTTFVGNTDEIDQVYIIIFDRSAFYPENFDQSLDYGTFITDLRNVEEAYQNKTLLSDLEGIFPVFKAEAFSKLEQNSNVRE
jgi:Ser-tRNA(Ala) deacylase AlaX